jgi:hypothetical protein
VRLKKGRWFKCGCLLQVVAIKQLNRDGLQGNREILVRSPHAQFAPSSKPG